MTAIVASTYARRQNVAGDNLLLSRRHRLPHLLDFGLHPLDPRTILTKRDKA